MAENITMTRISDLPDLGGSDGYMAINPHPNPYGIGQPTPGGLPPPIHNPPRNQPFPSTTYSTDIPQQHLPSHDIPMQYNTHDPQIQPSYVPPPKTTTDYVQEYQNSTARKMREHEERKRQERAASNTFDEYQVPIMVAILYFVFSLPVVNTAMKQFSFLSIHGEDGNFNMSGLVFKCLLFGGVFYSIHKMMKTLAEF